MSIEILHGRREGQQRSADGPPMLSTKLKPVGMTAQSVAVFQPKDWQRIQNSLRRYNAKAEEFKARQEAKKQMLLSSKSLVKNWGNTIEGQRLRKLQAREKREENEEIEKQKIDLDEAKLQAQQRKEAIEEARKMQYYQTDRVKRFHGALLLTEVLKERDAQVGMKLKRKAWEERREREVLALQKQQMEEKILSDHDNALKRIKERRELARFQIAQINDHAEMDNKEHHNELEEGKQIMAQVEEYKAARVDIHEQRKKDKIKLREIYKQDISSRELLNELKEQQDDMEDNQIQRFVNAKRAMARMRKEKEEEMFQLVQNHTEKMRSTLHAQNQQKADDEDSRILRAVTEQDKKRLAEERENSAKRGKAQFEMHQHRINVMKEAKEKEKQERQKNKSLLRAHVQADEAFLKKQSELDVEKKGLARNLQKIHRQQIRQREVIKEEITKVEKELDRENEALLVAEEEDFQTYAAGVIEAAERNGRNKYPLVKAAAEGPGGGRGPKFDGKAGIRPSYIVADATGVQLPHHRKDDETNYRNYGHVGKSGRRLGFTW